MKHIENLTIHGFRGLRNLELNNFGSINLFVGGNNSGKTSILEAIHLLEAPLDLSHYIKVSRARESAILLRSRLGLLDSLLWLFPVSNKEQENKRGQIKIRANIEQVDVSFLINCEEKIILRSNIKNDNLHIEYEDLFDDDLLQEEIRMLSITSVLDMNGDRSEKKFNVTDFSGIIKPQVSTEHLLKAQFVTPVDHRVRISLTRAIHEAIISGDRAKIINAIKLFDENIEGIEILSPDGRNSIPYINHKKLGLAPVSIFGDGLKKALTIVSAVVRAENGILLLDELETAIHASVLTELFSWLIKACKEFNIQLFATTHSLEAIDAVLDVSGDDLSELVIYRVGNSTHATFSKRFPGKMIDRLRNELGQDVR